MSVIKLLILRAANPANPVPRGNLIAVFRCIRPIQPPVPGRCTGTYFYYPCCRLHPYLQKKGGIGWHSNWEDSRS